VEGHRTYGKKKTVTFFEEKDKGQRRNAVRKDKDTVPKKRKDAGGIKRRKKKTKEKKNISPK